MIVHIQIIVGDLDSKHDLFLHACRSMIDWICKSPSIPSFLYLNKIKFRKPSPPFYVREWLTFQNSDAHGAVWIQIGIMRAIKFPLCRISDLKLVTVVWNMSHVTPWHRDVFRKLYNRRCVLEVLACERTGWWSCLGRRHYLHTL